MAKIFISHSWDDNAQTFALRDWLAANGWDDVFLDKDPQRGLLAGQRWQEEIRRAARQCEAVLFVISPSWAASKWCITEFLLAKSLGKRVFAVIVRRIAFNELPVEMVSEYQVVELDADGAQETISTCVSDTKSPVDVSFSKDGLARLKSGLEQAGLNARSFALDLERPRYPGLAALDTGDAAIFFGRDADIVRGMDMIRKMRDGSERIFAILGASGSGKSSFLRAGLWPRLHRSSREFLALPVLRPESAAINGEFGLVECLNHIASRKNLKLGRNRAHWRKLIEQGALATALNEIRTAHSGQVGSPDDAQRPPPLIILPIDQGEELFQPGRAQEEAGKLLAHLAPVLRSGDLMAIFAIRSDSYARLQAVSALEGLDQEPYSLPPITKGAIKDVIEGPATREQELLGDEAIKIDPLLTERLLNDWSGSDALPLLAFTLRRLVDDYGGDRGLDLSDYEEAGGLSGVLTAAIEDAMQSASVPQDPIERDRLVQMAFVPWLVSVDSQTREPLRRVARREDLPEETRSLVQCLVDARLLSSHTRMEDDKESAYVEVSHEALLRRWPLLHRIIDKEREALLVLSDVKRDAEAYKASEGSEESLLHRAGRLRRADALLARDDLQDALGETGRTYLAACRQREAEESRLDEERREKERSHIRRIKAGQRLASAFLLVVVVVVLFAVAGVSKVTKTTNQTRSSVLASLASEAYDRGQYESAMRLALTGIAGSDAPLIGFDASEAETQLGRAAQHSRLIKSFDLGEKVRAAGFSMDGKRVIAWVDKRKRAFDLVTGHEVGRPFPFAPYSIGVSPNWRASDDEGALVADASDNIVTISYDGRRIGRAAHDDDVNYVDVTANGAFVLTASDDGTARIWTPDGIERRRMSHDSNVLSAKFSPDESQVVTVSSDHAARIWNVQDSRNPIRLWHDNNVNSAEFNADGSSVVTASDDHFVRVWRVRPKPPLLDIQTSGEGAVLAGFDKSGRRIVGVSGGRIQVWDGATGRKLMAMTASECPEFFAFSKSYDLILGTMRKTARSWNASTGKLLHQLLPRGSVVLYGAPISQDGNRVLASASDGRTLVLDAATGRRISVINAVVENVEFSRDGTRVVGTSGIAARVWDADTGKELAKFTGDAQILRASFDPAGQRVVTTFANATVRIWTVASGDLLLTLSPHEPLLGATFGANGRYVVTFGATSARIWDAVRGTELASYYGGPVGAAELSPDGDRFLIAWEDGHVRIYDTGFASGLRGAPLTHAACDLLRNAMPTNSRRSLSRLTEEEFTAPVLDRSLDVDACQPVGAWRRVWTTFNPAK